MIKPHVAYPVCPAEPVEILELGACDVSTKKPSLQFVKRADMDGVAVCRTFFLTCIPDGADLSRELGLNRMLGVPGRPTHL